jgi:hypothetical protein
VTWGCRVEAASRKQGERRVAANGMMAVDNVGLYQMAIGGVVKTGSRIWHHGSRQVGLQQMVINGIVKTGSRIWHCGSRHSGDAANGDRRHRENRAKRHLRSSKREKRHHSNRQQCNKGRNGIMTIGES